MFLTVQSGTGWDPDS